MRIFVLVLGLVACYFPAVAGARGRGSRRLWIGFALVGMFIAAGAMMLGKALNAAIWNPNAALTLFEIVIRMAVSFAFGSFLAALLYRKGRSVEDLTLK